LSDPFVAGFAWGSIAVLGLLLSFFGGYYAALQERIHEVMG